MLRQVGPDYMTVCETFEATRFLLQNALKLEHYKVISYQRPSPRVGGGAAIIYNEQNFSVEEAETPKEYGVEACWAIFTPKRKDLPNIKRICVGSIYIAPKSKYKQQSVDHIVDVMFLMKARFGNQVNFAISGDFNKYPVSDILSANGAIKQVLSVPTRKSAILEVILTDLATLYYPPTSRPPLEVDQGKSGSNSDHNVVIFSPRTNAQFKKDRIKTTIKHRPLPQSKIQDFGQELVPHSWIEVVETEDGHQKAFNFHTTLMTFLNKHFPEKSVQMSSFDKDWMHPDLKYLHIQMTKEYYNNRKSEKWRKLCIKFRKEKRKAIKGMNYNQFADQLIEGTKKNFYKQVKKVGGIKVLDKKMFISSLDGKSDKECAEAIGLQYSAISQAYSPVDLASLPAYLPAQLPPQVEEREVFEKLLKLKKTKSTFPIDLPEKLRKEFAPELAAPLANIYNCCLQQGIFPSIWKEELVTPVPKTEILKEIKDTRKITCLSDYSKVYEGFLKKWILEDLTENENFSQFGGKKGIGAEHMIVCMVDRILKLLETTEGRAAVISSQYDWSNAYERQNPSKTIQKFISLRICSSLIPILIDFLSGRSMKVKFNGEQAGPFELVGGSPAGSYLGQLCYTTGCYDNTATLDIEEDDKYQYIDDLTLLELTFMADLLLDYNFRSHIASDIGLDQRFLPPSSTKTQAFHDDTWTDQNQTKLNQGKSKYILHSRMK
jgi:hypothetical protein